MTDFSPSSKRQVAEFQACHPGCHHQARLVCLLDWLVCLGCPQSPWQEDFYPSPDTLGFRPQLPLLQWPRLRPPRQPVVPIFTHLCSNSKMGFEPRPLWECLQPHLALMRNPQSHQWKKELNIRPQPRHITHPRDRPVYRIGITKIFNF